MKKMKAMYIGKEFEPMYDKLWKKIKYAKNSYSMEQLHEAKGAIDCAYLLHAITLEEYLELDHMCVAEGINNPEIFNHPNNK